MATLHGEEVKVGDNVFDVSATRGLGRVLRISERGIEVQFARGPRATFTESGVQVGKGRATLFWRDPIFVIPTKNELLWGTQMRLASQTRDALMEVHNG